MPTEATGAPILFIPFISVESRHSGFGAMWTSPPTHIDSFAQIIVGAIHESPENQYEPHVRPYLPILIAVAVRIIVVNGRFGHIETENVRYKGYGEYDSDND